MSRRGPDRARRLAIGRAILRAHADGATWKRISEWFAYGKTRLHAFMTEAVTVAAGDQAKEHALAIEVEALPGDRIELCVGEVDHKFRS
ncbi:MAG: hypothetical protein U1A72_13355 [Sulfuritalea sp.]|nr:hypothetical protein [Sulfuritalea sp.]